jgi:hypothetical protein
MVDIDILLPGDLPHGDLDERIPPNDENLVEVLERLSIQPVQSSEWARILSRADAAKELIEKRGIVTAHWTLPQIHHLTATLGLDASNDHLLERLDAMLGGDALPGVTSLEQRHDLPDHGFAPQAVYLINALAETRDERLVPRLRRTSELLTIDLAVSDYRFCYIHSIGYAAERIGTLEAGMVARDLMVRTEIHDRLIPRGSQATERTRETKDYIAERYAYLGLCLARGVARCGIMAGYERLAEYTEEIRLYLARSARTELEDLLGTDKGYDKADWLEIIHTAEDRGTLKPQPFTMVLA